MKKTPRKKVVPGLLTYNLWQVLGTLWLKTVDGITKKVPAKKLKRRR